MATRYTRGDAFLNELTPDLFNYGVYSDNTDIWSSKTATLMTFDVTGPTSLVFHTYGGYADVYLDGVNTQRLPASAGAGSYARVDVTASGTVTVTVRNPQDATTSFAFAWVDVYSSILGTDYDTTTVAIGTYGDECDTVTPDAAWNLRNISSVTGDGDAYSVLLDAQGDAVTRAFTDPAADFELIAHVTGMSERVGMVSLCALDANGTGVAFSDYSDNNSYGWLVYSYGYGSTGRSRIADVPTLGDHWLRLVRAKNLWYGAYSNDGATWVYTNDFTTDSRTITQVGILRTYSGGASQTIGLERFVYGAPRIDFSGSVASGERVFGYLLA